MSSLTVVDFWCNEFGMRARIALHELGIPFRFISEDLRVRERSDLVRRMNPVHHGGGEELKAAALGERPFFGGEEFGFLDVALVPFTAMFYGYEKHGGVDMEVECPALMRWVDRCRERESVREVLPSGEDMYAIHKEFYQIE